jgi:diadenosine tetraphosphatase ApaH/serine/threonine PP2A family protein phosphatase
MFVGEARIPEGWRVYAIGDVHGRLDCLTKMFKKIERDLAKRRPENHRIIMLGDYCDRGPNSAGVIDFLAKRAEEEENFICLLGNHDAWFIEFLASPEEVGDSFLYFGGRETLASYGIDASRLPVSAVELSHRLAEKLPPKHWQFLSGLQPSFTVGDYFFCHAGVRPGIELERQSIEDLIWIRDEFLYFPASFGKVVVHGHTPHRIEQVRRNRINVDTGAYMSGVLTCAVLEGNDCQFLRASR